MNYTKPLEKIEGIVPHGIGLEKNIVAVELNKNIVHRENFEKTKERDLFSVMLSVIRSNKFLTELRKFKN